MIQSLRKRFRYCFSHECPSIFNQVSAVLHQEITTLIFAFNLVSARIWKMVKLQDNQLEKEEGRALAMRQRFQERTERFLNAKQRTIGIDKEFLDQQVEERNRLMMLEKEDGIQEAIHQEEVLEYLEEQERSKEEAALRERQEVNETLSRQALQPKNNALGKGDPLDLDHCGPSSLQCFYGEDREHNDRKKDQQRQLRNWCSQGMKETYDKIDEEQQDKREYSKYVIEEDRMRCDMAKEKERHRRDLDISVMMENKQLAEDRQKRRNEIEQNEKQIDDEETRGTIISPFYCEDTDYAKSAVSDHRFRPDHFKGFATETLKSISDDNELVVAEKIFLKEEEERREQFWVEKQREMISQMEEVERKKRQLQDEDNKVQAETLLKQCEELKQKQLQMEQDRFGDIGNGFFQKFGTSCR